jgi:hypothetical protein
MLFSTHTIYIRATIRLARMLLNEETNQQSNYELTSDMSSNVTRGH